MEHFSETLKYEIGITLIPLVGDIVAKKLISYCGSAEAVFNENIKNLRKIPGIGESTIKSIKGESIIHRAEKEIEFLKKFRIQPLYYLSELYPSRLRNCIDSPVMLFFKGSALLNKSRVISIVGTRSPTPYGRRVCREIVDKLKDFEVLIVSGLAYGIDTIAHKTALQNQMETVAVLGHGLDRIYPDVNKKLAIQIIGHGGLLSDFLSGTKPDYINFPKRNRIVAGMCDAVIVVESAVKGGALITADIANSYNHDVFAVPGSIKEKYSEGCNYLIRTNRAALFQTVDEFILMMGWDDNKVKKNIQTRIFVDLNENEQKVVGLIRECSGIGFDKLNIQSGLGMSALSSILLKLELEGLITCLPGKFYKPN